MPNESQQEKPRRRTNPLRDLLKALVVPVFEEHAYAYRDGDEREPVRIMRDDDECVLRGIMGRAQLVDVRPLAIDHERTTLRISWMAGMFIGNVGFQYLVMGTLLNNSLFHVQVDVHLGSAGQMMIGCDLVVRRDDEPLVRQRIGELLQLTVALEGFFALRMPSRLHWADLQGAEIPWEDLPHGELDGFLDTAMSAPPSERTPYVLIRIAQGLSRWNDVLRLLREHPDELPIDTLAPLKAMACRELGRWRPAIEAAEEGGLADGRYVGGPWLSPSYLHSLILSL